MKKHTHYTSEFKPQKFPIVLVCDNISNATNIGSLFRISDAFGVEKLIFCGDNFSLGRRFKKTSRSTEKYVNYSIEANIEEVILGLRDKGFTINGLEITDNSRPISVFNSTKTPIALIIGNEKTGVSNTVLKMVDSTFHIPMYGHNSSMNVSQATSIALYQIIQIIKKV